jgi:hypothetical protein
MPRRWEMGHTKAALSPEMNLFRYGAAGDVLKRGWGDGVVRVVLWCGRMSVSAGIRGRIRGGGKDAPR